MKELGEKRAKEVIGETNATVQAGEKLAEAYKTLANTQEKNNTSEIANQVFQRYKEGLVK